MRAFFFAVIIILVSNLTVTCGQQNNINDDCGGQLTCAECIKTRNCIWCGIVIDPETEEPPLRCVSQQYAQDNHQWCNQGPKVNPLTDANFTEDLPLSTAKGSKLMVQIQPQVVNLQLRRGEEYRLKVRYRQAEDYPVDLYFLVDLSSSMKKFRNALAKLTGEIVAAMQNLTSNFQLGFGSFVDKKVRPMVVDGVEWNWENHYTFRNYLQLTEEYERFTMTVGRAEVVDSIDNPEGGFDAMMQTIVCKKEIGWRSNARHLLVHVSDASPHIAGDGRLAGIIEPNDEQCHLEKGTGLYTKGELQDYPSIGQINYQARKNNINIIFATIKNYTETYEAVKSKIENSAVGTFQKSNEIVHLIRNHSEKLVRSLKMTSNSTSKFLDVKFFSRCRDKDGELQQTDKCDGIRVNVTVEFEVVIKAMDCPEREEDWHQTIEIKPEGINEGVVVNVELICGCECSKKSDKEGNAIPAHECGYHGILECGICSCDQGYSGKSCECEVDESLTKSDAFMSACRKDNSSKICSSRGSCTCGVCSCNKQPNSDKQYYGEFCQCDNFSCMRHGEVLCTGHGHCDCGNCICDYGWTGETCACTNDTSQCIPPGDDAKICNHAGECICGECKCDKSMGRRGRFCEDCPSCPSQHCDEFKDCVECKIHKSGKIFAVDPSCGNCSSYDVRPVDKIEDDPNKINPGDHICRIAGDDGSTFVFKYVYENGEDKDPIILAEKDKKFRVIDDFLAATLGVIFLTLLIGLLILLLWKIATHIHDKREYEKFEKERAQVHWARGQNPLYKSAVTTFQNPVFDSTLDDEDVQIFRR